MGKFQELKVWQRSKALAVFIYKLTDQCSSRKGIFHTIPALGVRFESSKYLDIPAVQTGHPPWPRAKSTLSE
jgi:hypothetical protein